mgnify:CR=1 FL=1
MEKVPMTVRGEELLRTELDRLLKLRPQISEAIATARELGDLKENAEYHAAREEQGICEAQIRDIEYKLSVAQVIARESNQQASLAERAYHLTISANNAGAP